MFIFASNSAVKTLQYTFLPQAQDFPWVQTRCQRLFLHGHACGQKLQEGELQLSPVNPYQQESLIAAYAWMQFWMFCPEVLLTYTQAVLHQKYTTCARLLGNLYHPLFAQ